MSKQFATGFERPLSAQGVPLMLVIAISPDTKQAIYFERVYKGQAGEQLAIRSTLIETRGLLLLQDAGPFPAGTAVLEASVTNQSRATEPDPVQVIQEDAAIVPKFATGMEKPLLFGDYPLQLAMGIGNTRQTIFLERQYLDASRQQLAIRSDAVLDREVLDSFNIHEPEPPMRTRFINVWITNQYNPEAEKLTKEYEALEYNELEYN